ncbi:MAG: exonuclease [Daejeonella sp.]|uniref:exonuclease n=1 Tax=Daejeonella sp. JGW-45 TaxID=3034148 RepID=UPI0023EB60B2|nr:exonuclease [Daejeonella sp. JGW-45]
MIIDDFLVINENGLYCKTGEFYLDPILPCPDAVISHAHGDHAVKGNLNVYCTAPTEAIMKHRYHKNAGKNFFVRGFNQPFLLNGIKITFIPAGHIIGSAQVLMEYNNVRYLYTGDYKLQDDPTCEKIEFVKADVLITETTFADPSVKHPDAASEIKKLNAFNHHVLLGSYSLGKAQRLISLLNEHCPQRSVLVHHSILPLNKIYESFGYKPGVYELYNRKSMKQVSQNLVYIVPPLTFDSYIRAKNVVRAFASGWQRLQVVNGVQLLISDHVDWDDILTMMAEIKPREVWTLHGNGKYLREYYKNQIPVKLLNAC